MANFAKIVEIFSATVEFETGKKYILSLWLEICMLPFNSYFANKMFWQINLNKSTIYF
jgi:hypothetical protein